MVKLRLTILFHLGWVVFRDFRALKGRKIYLLVRRRRESRKRVKKESYTSTVKNPHFKSRGTTPSPPSKTVSNVEFSRTTWSQLSPNRAMDSLRSRAVSQFITVRTQIFAQIQTSKEKSKIFRPPTITHPELEPIITKKLGKTPPLYIKLPLFSISQEFHHTTKDTILNSYLNQKRDRLQAACKQSVHPSIPSLLKHTPKTLIIINSATF